MKLYNLWFIVLLCLILMGCTSSKARTLISDSDSKPANVQKIPVEKADELPRHEYKLKGSVIETIESDELFLEFATKYKKDLLIDLKKYEIRDYSTLVGYYKNLYRIYLLEGNYKKAARYLSVACKLPQKNGAKLICGHLQAVLLIATVGGKTPEQSRQIVASGLRRILQNKPFGEIKYLLTGIKNDLEIWSKPLIYDYLKESIEPAAANGMLSKKLAATIIYCRYRFQVVKPYKDVILKVYSDYLNANQKEKQDIWLEKEVDLSTRKNMTPVLVAVWDSGVDTALFKESLFINENEIPQNGVDDDGNGYIDDVHGIAYDLDANKTTSLLYEIAPEFIEEYQPYVKGKMDMFVGIDSEESSKLRKKFSSMQKGELAPFIEGFSRYMTYIHGTHVAGIVVHKNPAARILVARFEEPLAVLPPVPTVEAAYKCAERFKESIKYFKHNGVRVVNISWGRFYGSTENALEKHNIGDSQKGRKKLARKIFNILAESLKKAMSDAPNILFVAAAGNSNNDIAFDEGIPAAFRLSNLITIGAVDRSGDVASFTGFGDSVDAYACGVNVKSLVPGGDSIQMSGTSMAAPNATNLAAKLLAVNPALSPPELRRIMLDTTDEKVVGNATIRLLNPKKAFSFLKENE